MNTYMTIGLIIYSSFYINFYIKLFLQKKHGINTLQVGFGSKPKRTSIIEITFVAVLFVGVLIQISSIIFVGILPVLLQNEILRNLGILISVMGIILLILSMVTLGDNWRAGIDYNQKTKLITTGIYMFSRNPAFLGFDLFFIGMSLLFSNIFNIVISCILILVINQQILEEEKFLTVTFGKEYSDYQKKTRRYL